MTAELNRLPEKTTKPASVFIGASKVLITSGRTISASRQLSPMDRPETVMAFSRISPCFINSATTAGTPPAWK